MTTTDDILDAEIIDDTPAELAPIPPPVFAIAVREGMSAEDTAVNDWLDEQRSPHTRRSYETAIAQWRAHLAHHTCCSLGLPHRRHAFAWREEMKTARLKPKTIDARLVAARSFYDYLCDLPGSPLIVNPIKSKKLLLNQGVHQATQALSRDEVHAFTKAARKAGPDRWLLAVFLATTGCRISEATKLKGEDLGRQAGHAVATLTRKGGRREEVSVDSQVYDLLLKHTADDQPDHHVFQPHRARGRTGGPFTYSGAYEAVRAISDHAAELMKQRTGQDYKYPAVHPHMLRATLATQAIDAGREISDVQDQLGHAKTETTRLYDRGGRRLRRMAGVAGVMAEMVDLEDED